MTEDYSTDYSHETENSSCSDADMGDLSLWSVVDICGNSCFLCRV